MPAEKLFSTCKKWELLLSIAVALFVTLLLVIRAEAQEGAGDPTPNVEAAATATLFLDDDNDWDTDHHDDIDDYVPRGFDVTGSNPQVVRLICRIVPASAATGRTATFSLENTTNYIGYAMNKGTSTDPDFSLPSTTTIAFGSDGTARINLTSKDYGGYTEVRVAISGTAPALGPIVKKIPLDENSDHIADAGWDATDGTTNEHVNDPGPGHEGDDLDANPAGDGHHGDYLTAFEEYRGLFVRDNHRRTSPARKDVFVYSEVKADGTNQTMGDAVNLTTWNHRIYESEMVDKVINFNTATGMPGHAQHHDRWAVTVYDGGYHATYGGMTFPAAGAPTGGHWWPNVVDRCDIYVEKVREITPPRAGRTDVDPLDDPTIRDYLGHELGHAHGMQHYLLNDPNDPNTPTTPAAASVMVTDPNPPNWQTIPHNYIAIDLDDIRVRQ
jgi:hypothetical protein